MSESTGATAQEIAERVWLSIAERRLRPGVRLKEGQMAEIFEVSRARVRQALAVLQRDGLVTIIPNRGAFVSEPSVEEARDVFFVRRTIEQRIVERLCQRIAKKDAARLRAHVSLERKAADQGDMTDCIKLSGGFHLLLAEIAQSDFLFGIMRDLITRTTLITAIYRVADQHNCGPDEHDALVAAIAVGDETKAVALMLHHLEHVESELDLSGVRESPRDLRAALM